MSYIRWTATENTTMRKTPTSKQLLEGRAISQSTRYPEPICEAKMTTFEAAMILDGCWELTSYEPSEETYIEACQHLIDTGDAWTLQGRVGRECYRLIYAGKCFPAKD